jgi:hypothetical protein
MSDRIINQRRFIDTVIQKGGRILSEYENFSTKVELECDSQHRWLVTPNHVVNGGSWCPKCPKISSLRSKEKFLQILAEKGGTLISEYVNNNTNVTIRCSFGHEWQVTPHSVAGVMKSWCPFCSNNSPKQAAENFNNKVKENGGIVLGKYENAYSTVRIRCDKGHEWDCIPHNIISLNRWCAKCYQNDPEQACDRFINTVTNKGGIVLGHYINTYTRVRVRCKNNHEWDCVPGSVNAGDWCRACAGTCPIEAYKRLLSIVNKNKGKILGNYINSQTKLVFQCEFGHIWETCPSNITNSGSWCPGCNESNGERSLRYILTKHNIPFTSQKEHPSLLGRRYDFYFMYNDKEFYVEYDGEQHFNKVDFFCKTDEDFKYRRDVDVLKSHTVIKNNGHLIRLDYTLTEEKIESHLLKAINSNDKLYLSNPEMYKWIINGVNPQPIPITINLKVLPVEVIPPIYLTLNIIKDQQ